MPSTLENPFTPKSALPLKRLFGGGERIMKRKLGKEGQARIKEVKEKFVQYGKNKILKSQAEFLYAIEKQMLEIWEKRFGKEAKEAVVERMAEKKIEVDKSGNIKEIDITFLELKNLPSLDELTNLQVLICSHNELVSLPSLDKLTNLQLLDCSYNHLTSLPSLDKLMDLKMLYCYSNKLSGKEKAKISDQVPKNCKLIM